MNKLVSSEFKEPNLLHHHFIFNIQKMSELIYY